MSSTIVANGQTLDIAGIIPFDTIEVQGTTARTNLQLSANATLNNDGTIRLDGTSSNIVENVIGSAFTLDNVNGTIEGAGQITPGGLINEAAGTINADSTLALTIDATASNAGLIEATNSGGLIIGGTFLTTIDNFIGTQLGTIAAIGPQAVVSTFFATDIAGGVLTTSNGGVIVVPLLFSSTLDGSTVPITITAGSSLSNQSEILLIGTIDNAGTIVNASTGAQTFLQIEAGSIVTLTGGGMVEMTGPGAVIDGSGATPGTLDNINNTIEGSGQIGDAIEGSLALMNEASGTIDANSSLGMTIELSLVGNGPTLANSGLIEATNTGYLLINNPVSGSGTLLAAGDATLELGILGTAIASTQTLEIGANSTLILDDPLAFRSGTVANLGPGATFDFTFHSVEQAAISGGSLAITLDAGLTTLDYALVSPDPSVQLHIVPNNRGGDDLVTAACYGRGTRIATPRGEVAVEDLREGDTILTASGTEKPIVWIGCSRVDCRRHARPDDVIPVRIRAGALAPNVPQRDLVVSPGHAIYFNCENPHPDPLPKGEGTGPHPDPLPQAGEGEEKPSPSGRGLGEGSGVLIPVGYLVNGSSIVREENAAEVTYYHIELPGHDVLLAEGLPAESYLDDGNRAAFDNSGGYRMLHPNYAPQSWDDACAPMRQRGPEVAAVKRQLRQRLRALGYRVPRRRRNELSCEIVNGDGSQRLAPTFARRGLYHFRVPAGATEIRILSARNVPAGLIADSGDSRTLGAQLALVLLDGEWIALDSPILASGFHAVESDASGIWRWTDGAGTLRLPHMDKPRMLEVFVRNVMRGWLAPAAELAA